MTPEYAFVDPSDDVLRIATNIDPDVETKAGWRWLPVERTQDTPGPNQVLDPPSAPVVGADKVTIHTAVRDMTDAEIKAATPKVSTYTIVRRLEDAGLIDAAEAALESNRTLYRRFYTAGGVMVTDPDARAFLTAIGADPDAILALETDQ